MNRNLTILLSLVAFTLPLVVPSWHGKLIVLALVGWLIDLAKNNGNYKWPDEPVLLLLIFMVVLACIGLIYSDNKAYGWSMIETFLPCVILPTIFFSQKDTGDTLKIIALFFVGGVITLNMASLILISYNLWDSVNSQASISFANSRLVEIHPTFLSLYISISIFIIVDFYFPLHLQNRKRLGWILFSLITLLTFLIWLNSRVGLLSFLVTGVVYFYYKYQARYRIGLFVVLLLVLLLVVLVPGLNQRFISSPLAITHSVGSEDVHDSNFSPLIKRKEILTCSFQIIDRQHVLFGYGTGDGKQKLEDCLGKFQTGGYAGLDAHNEYLALTHRLGIFGLLPFATLIIFLMRDARRVQSPFLLAFVLLFVFTALFENVFSAQKGATFFALLCPVLMLYAKQQTKARLEKATV